MESYRDINIRISNELNEALKPYDFYQSTKFNSLMFELEEALDNNEIDDAEDIIHDIEYERKIFIKNLPDWFKIRWGMMVIDDLSVIKAVKIYQKNIYKEAGR